MKKLKILCWNVNGIRAWSKKGCMDWVLSEKPDIFCFQETKAERTQLDETLLCQDGYECYFEHSRTRKGYSGVAIYTKIAPEKVETGLILKDENGKSVADQEGRYMEMHFKDLILINCYFPNGGGESHRLEYKLRFYEAFLTRVLELQNDSKNKDKKVIFCGDVNVAHTEIDIARPKENENHVGFLPVERAWVDKVTNAGFIDTFRALNPDARDVYTWWDVKSAARDRNIGWRIDYFFINKDSFEDVTSMQIHTDVFGSDHCPISLEVKI